MLWSFFTKQERYRQEQLAMEQWRTESREHEKQMFSIFCGVLSQCNAALNILLKARLDQSDDNTLRPNHNNSTDHSGVFFLIDQIQNLFQIRHAVGSLESVLTE